MTRPRRLPGISAALLCLCAAGSLLQMPEGRVFVSTPAGVFLYVALPDE